VWSSDEMPGCRCKIPTAAPSPVSRGSAGSISGEQGRGREEEENRGNLVQFF
jgi:hypothetical protein